MTDYIKSIRKKIGHQRLLVPTCGCVVLNKINQVLLQFRSDTKNWGCPGGIMDIGETVIECLKREVFEETGLKIKKPRLLGIYSGLEYYATYPNKDKTAPVQIIFIVGKYTGKIKKDKESKELKFFSLDNLPKPLNKYYIECLNESKKYLKNNKKAPGIK